MAEKLTVEEFAAKVPTDDLPGDSIVVRAAIAIGAQITIEARGSQKPDLSDPTFLGENAQRIFALQKFCEGKGITALGLENMGNLLGGFTILPKILSVRSDIPFSLDLSFLHKDSRDAGALAALVCALTKKPVDEAHIVFEGYNLQKNGLPALMNVDAVVPESKHVEPFDPFKRNIMSPLPVTRSPVPFLEALKKPPVSRAAGADEAEAKGDTDADDTDGDDTNEVGEENPAEPFTQVTYKRVVYGASADRPKSLPTSALYNPPAEQTRIWAWAIFKENGLKRQVPRKLEDIFGDWIKFVLKNHDEFKTGNKTNFDSYLRGQLGDDFDALQKLIPK
jgi:hypothetical protein